MAISNSASGFRPGVCTSTTRPTSPFNGQVIYETDTKQTLVWQGSAWVMLTDADTPPGLQRIANATFSGVTNGSPLDVNNIFSSEYSNYKLIIRSNQTVANGNNFFRMRTASTIETANLYNYATYGSWVAPGPVYNNGNYATTNPFSPDGAFYFGAVGNGYSVTGTWDIFSPNESRNTRTSGSFYVDYSGSNYNTALTSIGELQTTTSYTGIRIYPSAGSMAGEYWVYGYRK